MKKTTLLIAVTMLGGSLLAMSSGDILRKDTPEQQSVSAMGFLINDESRPAGWYTFPVTDASSPQLICETPKVSAGAMADGVYYAQTYTPGPVADAWNRFDINSGTMTKLADCPEGSPLYVDMTYDYSDENLLAIYHYGMMSSVIGIVNPVDGSSEIYADAPGLWLMTLACSYEGDIYTVANDGYLYSLDKQTKTFSKIGKVDSGIEYMQSMEFDHSTGVLYWASSTSWGGYFYTIDPYTGQGTYISDLGRDGEMTGLYIPFSMAADEAPEAVSSIQISDPAHNGNATISMVLPSQTVSGKELDKILSVIIEADGEIVDTRTDGVLEPGAKISIQATLPLGLHTFKVYAVNEAGNGVPRSKRAYIGVDVPAAPTDISVEADGLNAVVTWKSVTIGANGGYIDPSSIRYEVVRLPGEEAIASDLNATTCKDRVEKTGVYTYSVTAVSSEGRSPEAKSAPTVIGTEVNTPYICDFEDVDELLMWTIIDANGDNATWERSNTYDSERTMMMRGAYGRTVDDWLITPPMYLESGKNYKIVYDAGCMNSYYPAHYTLTFGKEPTVDGQAAVLKEFTTDLRNLNKTYVYLPEIKETGVYYLGFHADWTPGLASLYISNVTIEENEASWLTGIVTDGVNLIEGASVEFGADKQKVITGADGAFEFIEIVPGSYDWTVSKFGFEPTSGNYTFAPLEHKEVEIKLAPIPTATLTGRVVNAEGYGLENASVNVHGYDAYTAVTDRDGRFSLPGVYCKGEYTVDVYALNYEPATRQLQSVDADADLGTFCLAEKLIAPGNVTAEADRQNASVSWEAPVDAPAEFRYDDGTDNLVFSMEMSDISEYTAVGVIYDTPAVFTSMSWHVWDTATYAETVDVIVFDLDEDGNPTNRILYEENGLESENYNWHECLFRYPIVAPRGALFTLRGDARLCMDGGGETDEWPSMQDKMVMTHDYRTEPFSSRYADDNSPIFRGNLLLRAAGLPYGAPRKETALDRTPSVEYDIWRLADGDETSAEKWVKLNSEPITGTSFNDESWNTVAKGMYRFAVKTVYKDGNVSYPSFSKAIPRQLTSKVSVSLLTNAPGESADGATVLLSGKDNANSYTSQTDSEGKVEFSDVWEGEYLLTCTAKGFDTLTADVEISGEADSQLEYTLIETVKAPSNLKIEETEDPSSRLLRWNVVMGLFDDIEGHDDWAINSPGEIGWSYIDGDGYDTYYSPNYEFPDAGMPMAFSVINPSKTVPSMTDNYLDTHSGEKVLISWATRNGEQNDDYIISPRLEMGDDFVVSFWSRGYWSRYEETLRVGYSTTGNAAEDFIWIGDPITVDWDIWTQKIVAIPSAARYVAINYISKDKYFIAIDDIFIGAADKIPGLTAQAPAKVAGQVVAYDVYLDNEKVASTTETSHLLENLSEGSHTAGVKSRYASGETEMATIDFEILKTGVDASAISGALTVKALRGAINVTGAQDGDIIEIYGPDGVAIASMESADGFATVPVAPGFYIVKVNRVATSLMVP